MELWIPWQQSQHTPSSFVITGSSSVPCSSHAARGLARVAEPRYSSALDEEWGGGSVICLESETHSHLNIVGRDWRNSSRRPSVGGYKALSNSGQWREWLGGALCQLRCPGPALGCGKTECGVAPGAFCGDCPGTSLRLLSS